MPTILPNIFTTISWNEGEEDAAKIFPDPNKLYLIAIRGDTAQKKLALSLDPTQPNALEIFIQAQAHLDGQLEMLTFLIGD